MLKLPDTQQSLWRESYRQPLYPVLSETVHADVAIVGGGITGLTAAYLLLKQGRRVAVIEKATLGGGTSGRTTGKVSSQHNLIYADLLKRHGAVIAQSYATINQAAIEKVANIIATEKIECNWSIQDNFIFTTQSSKAEELRAEAMSASNLGLPATYVHNVSLPFNTEGAVKFTDQASMNTQSYLLGLARAIQNNGGYIYENSEVTTVKHRDHVEVGTKQGSVVAKDIIIATNVPTLPLAARGTYCLLEYPQESYIVAARIPQAMAQVIHGMYISPDKNHYSILPFMQDGQPYVLVGGEGHLSGLRGSSKARYKRLAAYAEKHFAATEITHCWSDRDYLSYDRLPLIGKLYPSSKHIYVASAFSKWGLSGGTAAATILTDIITGKGSPYEDIFTPHRLSAIKAIPRATVRYITGKSH